MFLDWSSIEIGRIRRAKSLKLINVNDDRTYAECKGSGSEPYRIHEGYCSCPDYRRAGYICKHMIALAGMRGDLDIDAIIEEDDLRNEVNDVLKDLSLAYTYYHLFNKVKISDDEYDELKSKYFELTEKYKNLTGTSFI